MTQISPTILAKDEAEFAQRVATVSKLGLTLHIDVMDGAFVPNATFAPVDRLHHIVQDMPFEVHLMVNNPEHMVPEWVAGGAKRVFFHVEATPRAELIRRAVAEEWPRLGLVLNPDTPVDALDPVIKSFNHVMVMSVQPGFGGQEFNPNATERIREIKQRWPHVTVSVDGGVKPGNAAQLAAAGADTLMVGSALTGAADPAAALQQFQEALGGGGTAATTPA